MRSLNRDRPHFSHLRVWDEKNRVCPHLSGGGVAAVDDDHLAGDEAVGLDQAHHGLGDVVGGDDALEGRRLRPLAHQVLVLVPEHALHPVAFHPAGRDRVDADVGAEVPGERLGEIDHRGLACGVGQRLRAGTQAADARRVDDAPFRFLQHGRCGPGDLEKPAHIDREDAVPFLQRQGLEILRLPRRGGAGVVDQHIEAAESLLHRLQHGAHRGLIADVAAHQQPPGGELLRLRAGFGRRRLGRAVGGGDVAARVRGARLSEPLGQPFVIENRAGGDGYIGFEAVTRSDPDGYTVAYSPGSSMMIAPHIVKRADLDPMKLLVPVVATGGVSLYVLLHPGVPANNYEEFLAYARANPGKLNYGTPGNGTSPHIATEVFNREAKVKLNHVPYKGAGPALNDLLGGQIQLAFDPGVGLNAARSGKLRMVAVAGPVRHPDFPDVPTLEEKGIQGVDGGPHFDFYAPRATPREALERPNAAAQPAMNG